MITNPPSLGVQLWAPGLDPLPLISGLQQAGGTVEHLATAQQAQADRPLLLVYADPHLWIRQPNLEQAAACSCSLLAALPQLLATGHCRLVNLGCLSVPALVGWCVQPTEPPPLVEVWPQFAEPQPLDALLALQLLCRQPDLADAYQALECHPLAARLDGRAVDTHVAERYRQACRWEALLAAREHQNEYECILSQLAAQHGDQHSERLARLVLQEDLQQLSARLEEAELLRKCCGELALSVQAQQQDLEALSRRLMLTEQLVASASQASCSTQVRIAQLMTR